MKKKFFSYLIFSVKSFDALLELIKEDTSHQHHSAAMTRCVDAYIHSYVPRHAPQRRGGEGNFATVTRGRSHTLTLPPVRPPCMDTPHKSGDDGLYQ